MANVLYTLAAITTLGVTILTFSADSSTSTQSSLNPTVEPTQTNEPAPPINNPGANPLTGGKFKNKKVKKTKRKKQ